MKKTTTIHLAGMVYNIEEDGYQTLKQYIDDIHRVFAAQKGVDEMIADIEVRIAELFQERINEHKEVVTQADVDEVISIMGSPNQFDEDGEDQQTHEYKQADDSTSEEESKRLYRDTDEGVVAGVIAGLGHYFNIDPVFIRVLWILLVLLGGAGILIYIIAWIAIPEAKTTSEKLRMRGQSANLDNIKEFADKVKMEAKSGAQRASKSVRESVRKSGGIISRFIRFCARLVGIGMIVAGVIGLIFVSIGFIGDFSYIYLDRGVIAENLSTVLDVVFMHPGWAYWLILIVSAIPLIFLSVFGAMLLSKRMRKLKVFVLTLLVIWIAAIVGISMIAIKTGVGFTETYKTQNRTVIEKNYNALSLHLFEDSLEITDDIDFKFDRFLSVSSNNVEVGYTRIKIVSTTDSLFSYSIEMHSKGSTLRNAKENTDKIQFELEQKDSILNIPTRYSFPEECKFRDQKVTLQIFVPIGKQIILNGNLEDYPMEIQTKGGFSEDLLERSSIWKSTTEGMVFVEN